VIPFRGCQSIDPERRLHLRIGVIDLAVESDLEEIIKDLGALYGDFHKDPLPAGNPRDIVMQVKAICRVLPCRRRYAVLGDGKALWTARGLNEVLPYVEWGINWRVIARYPEFLQIHAATLARSGGGLMLVAESGLGKSTLAAALFARGWSYLSDEFALIDPDRLVLEPFPKALCIKSGSFALVEGLGLPIRRGRHYVKSLKGEVGYVSPMARGPGGLAGSTPVRFVVFPRYVENAEPRLYPISRAQAAFHLAGHALNRHVFGVRTLSILGRIVRGARCYVLDAGSIGKTCDLLDRMAASQVESLSRSDDRIRRSA